MKTSTIKFGKYFLLSFLALGLTVSSCKKEEETDEEVTPEATFSSHTQVQVPFVLKETGELCPPCGDWAWTAWEGVIANLEGKALLFSQYSDFYVSNSHFLNQELDPANSVMNAFRANFPLANGKPYWYTNGIKYEYNDYAGAQAAANTTLATPAADVDVSAAYKIEWEGNNLTVTAQAKLYDNLIGNYYMGVYIIEDKAKGTQSGHPQSSPDLEHHLVMRGSLGGGVWGDEIIAGTADAGAVIEKSYTKAIPSTYVKDNLSVGVIIWRKNGTKYFYKQAATNQKAH